MQHTLTIARRQFASYFNSPVAYIVISVILLFTGFFFWQQFFLDGRASIRIMWLFLVWGSMFGIPALTMGLLAEEKRTGTIELLLTMPVKDSDVILGKFFGVLGLYAVMLILTLPYPLSVASLGDLDWGQVAAGYLGMLLMGAAMLAIGLMCSSWTKSQIVAFFIAVFFCMWIGLLFDKVLVILPQLGIPASWSSIIEWLSFDFHRRNMERGVIDSRDLFFFLAAIGIPLLISFRALESRRWR
jgi:ABC-2 type transport system permease protein